MKFKFFIFFAFSFFVYASSLFAQLPGDYEMVVPHIPPSKNSLAKVKLVEVFAFDCIHCFNFNRDVHPKLVDKFGDKIEIFPMPIGWRGHDPGRLYFIAEEKGKGHKVLMMIFDFVFEKGLGKQMFERDKLQFVAKLNGLTNEFKMQMDSPNIVRKMNNSVQYANARNIDSTPTIVIEDTILTSSNYNNLVTIINALLKNPVK